MRDKNGTVVKEEGLFYVMYFLGLTLHRMRFLNEEFFNLPILDHHLFNNKEEKK